MFAGIIDGQLSSVNLHRLEEKQGELFKKLFTCLTGAYRRSEKHLVLKNADQRACRSLAGKALLETLSASISANWAQDIADWAHRMVEVFVGKSRN